MNIAGITHQGYAVNFRQGMAHVGDAGACECPRNAMESSAWTKATQEIGGGPQVSQNPPQVPFATSVNPATHGLLSV